MEQTRIAYLDLKTGFNLADTLTDYTDALFALTSDEVKFDVPAEAVNLTARRRPCILLESV